MNNFEPRIFEFETVNDYLAAYLQFKQKERPQFSMRSWASKMGFASPSTLSEIISKKRKTIPSHIPKILRGLKFNLVEKHYFEFLIYLDNSEEDEDKNYYRKELKHLKENYQHTKSFIENIHLPATRIDEAILISEKLKMYLEKIKEEKSEHHFYQLSIHFIPRSTE